MNGETKPDTAHGDSWKRKGWAPTPENINALPEPIKYYVYLLETRADPAHTERNLWLTKDENDALRAKIKELKAHEPSVGMEDLQGLASQFSRKVLGRGVVKHEWIIDFMEKWFVDRGWEVRSE